MSEEKKIARSAVIFDLPLGINLPDDVYTVTTVEGPVNVQLKKIEKKQATGLPKNVKIASGATITGDRWGRLFHTRVAIIVIHKELQSYSPIMEINLRKKAIPIINRILSVYSFITNEPIHTLAQVDIFSESFKHFDSQENEVPGCVLSLSTGGLSMKFGSAAGVDANKLTQIKEMLEKNTKIHLFNELMLNSKNHLFYDNPRLSIIEANTAFEVLVYELIFDGYKKQGMDDAKILKILEKTGLKNLLKDHIIKATGFDFGESYIYKIWNENAYEKRNKIIHYGVRIPKDEAYRIFSIYHLTMNFLGKLNPI